MVAKVEIKMIARGDENIKIFHLSTSSRRWGHYIDKFVVQGNVIDNPGDIREVITEYFELHFNNSQAVKIKEWSCNLRSLNTNSSDLLEQSFSEKKV